MVMSVEYIGPNLQPFTGNGDVSIWVKNSGVGRSTSNKPQPLLFLHPPPPFKKNLDPPNCCDKEVFLIRIAFRTVNFCYTTSKMKWKLFQQSGMFDVEGRILYFVLRLVLKS